MNLRECYEVLQQPYGASPREVRAAYRRLVRIWHPDRHPVGTPEQKTAIEQFGRINAAYTALKKFHFSVWHSESEADVLQNDIPEPDIDIRAPEDFRETYDQTRPFRSVVDEILDRSDSRPEGSSPSNAHRSSGGQQDSTRFSRLGREVCAYMGGDPGLSYLSTGLLGCAAMLEWTKDRLLLTFSDQSQVTYPAACLRSIHLGTPWIILKDCTVTLELEGRNAGRTGVLRVKLRFSGRQQARNVADRLIETFLPEQA